MPTRLNSGDYRYLATLHRRTNASDFGNSVAEDEPLRRLWINIRPLRSTEQNTGDQMTTLERFELFTPWTPDELTTEMEIRAANKTFAINGILNVDEENVEFRITATKV